MRTWFLKDFSKENRYVFRRKKVRPETFIIAGEFISERFDAEHPEGFIKCDFLLQDLKTFRRQDMIEHKIRKEKTVLRFGISHVTRKVRSFQKCCAAGFKDPVNFLHEPARVIEMLDNVFGENFIKGVIRDRVWIDVQIMRDIGVAFGVNVYANGSRHFVDTAANVEDFFLSLIHNVPF